MKRSHLRLLRAVGLLAVLLVVLVIVVGATGGPLSRTRTETLRVGERLERLEVQVGAGDVRVVATDRDDVVVRRVTSRFLREAGGGVAERDGVLVVSGRCDGFWLGACSVDVTVEVPASLPAVVRAGDGDVTVVGSSARLQLSTTAGDVRGEDLRSPEVDARSAAGDVTLDLRVPPADVRARTAAGDVAVSVPRGTYNVRVETVAGDERVRNVIQDELASRGIDVSSTAGDVSVTGR